MSTEPLLILYEAQKFRAFEVQERLQRVLQEFQPMRIEIVESTSKFREKFADIGQLISIFVINWNLNVSKGSNFLQYIKSQKKYDKSYIVLYGHQLSEAESRLIHELNMDTVILNWEQDHAWHAAFSEYFQNRESESPEQFLRQLERLLLRGDLNELEGFLKTSPGLMDTLKHDPARVHLYAEYELLKHRPKLVIEVLKEMFEKHMNEMKTLKVLNILGKAYCMIGDFEEASVIFDKLGRTSPLNLNHKIYFAQSLMGLERYTEARELYDAVLEQAPLDGAHQGKAMLALSQGHMDEAVNFLSKIEESYEDPVLSSYFNNRGVVLIKQNRILEAIDFYKNALFFVSKEKGTVLFNIALAYHKKGDYDEAKEKLKQALALDQTGRLKSKKIVQFYEKFENQNPSFDEAMLSIDDKMLEQELL